MPKSTVGHTRNVTTEYSPSVNLRCYIWLFQAKLRKIVSRDLMLLLSLFDMVWSNYIFNSKCVGEIHAGKKSAPGHQTDLTRATAESDPAHYIPAETCSALSNLQCSASDNMKTIIHQNCVQKSVPGETPRSVTKQSSLQNRYQHFYVLHWVKAVIFISTVYVWIIHSQSYNQ